MYEALDIEGGRVAWPFCDLVTRKCELSFWVRQVRANRTLKVSVDIPSKYLDRNLNYSVIRGLGSTIGRRNVILEWE